MIITFNDKKLNDYVYINNLKGLGLPPTKDISVDFMNTSGSYYTRSLLGERVITLDCTMVQKKNENVYEKFDKLKGILNPFNGEQRLKFSKYPDRHLNARFSGSLEEEVTGTMFKFPISFTCSDPLFYSDNRGNLSLTRGYTYTIKNEGNTNSSELTVTGSLLTGVSNIINTTTGKSLRLYNDTGVAKQITIDFKNASITSGPQNVNQFYMSGEFFELVPGENRIKFDIAGVVYWRSTWI